MAVVTYAEFIDRFPEFEAAPDTLVNGCLADAEEMCSVYSWPPAKRALGVKYLAAHLVATNPKGEFAKLDSSGKTAYMELYERLEQQVPAGFRVI